MSTRPVSVSDRAFGSDAVSAATLLRDRQRVEQAMHKQNERLRVLWEAAGVLLTTDEPDAMLRGLFSKLSASLGLDVYFNFMVTETGDALRLVSCAGITEVQARDLTRLEFGQAVCGNVALHRRPIHAFHIQESQESMVQLVKGYGIRAYACNPLLVRGRLLGTLSFASRTRDEFDPEEIEFLETISQYVTVAYERLRFVEQLRQEDRRKDEFIATLAHELRNPLAPLHNGLQLIRLAKNDAATVDQARDMMERQVQHMVRLVDDLLDVSRISRNKLELRKENIELAAVVASAIETTLPNIEAAKLDLTVALPPEPVVVHADPVRLAQALANLLSNAAKYTEPGGRIWLTAELVHNEVVLRVRDTGIGIPAEKLAHIFDMFVQVELGRSQGGLGIGLTLVERLVRLHGGSVHAHSDGPGKGSEFTVRLPVAGSPKRSGDAPASGPSVQQQSRRILVVDDNRDAADSLSMMLRFLGHEVRTAYDGRRGLDALPGFRPQVALLDLGMPELNGYETARRVRALPEGKSILLLALTGWGQEEDKRRSHEAGFDAHLVKPVDLATLEKLLATPPA